MKKLGLAISHAVSFLVCGTLFSKHPSETNYSQNRGYILPQPAPEFKRVLGTTYKESKPDTIIITNAPQGTSNVPHDPHRRLRVRPMGNLRSPPGNQHLRSY